ncbi:hypothetical protein [Corallococcus macrosporus]|uniref:Uncharacterized protein n=1 Tax=Myxococcus fulvus (strain ATCC BAA-855 / HW-1) TaxID=483219 RepID=F8CAD5_MYXFH|nr:hypothetical protein [Corallococcus macrosporus]AEI64592.1 hypothetical protein LILAB_13435 [Corallococcus macrosporus]
MPCRRLSLALPSTVVLGALLLLPSAAAARTAILQKDGQWQLQQARGRGACSTPRTDTA